MRFRLAWGTLLMSLVSCSPSADTAADETGVPSGIVWYGVLKDGLAEAERSNKPILLVSAAPQCLGVPGVW